MKPPRFADWAALGAAAERNRPRRKPQLWEDLALALPRRIAFELGRHVRPGWLERSRTITLSNVGFLDGRPPLRIRIVPGETTNQAMFLFGVFEISETRLIQALLRPGMTFLDVGANIGYYTIIAARLVGPSGAVHAFEPNDGMRAALETNIGLNEFHNVVVHPEAVARETGAVEFYDSEWAANQGISSILPGSGRSTGRRVPSVSLDDFVGRLGGERVDLVKMDIEGAESLAIEGGRRVLGRPDAPPLIFEAADLGPVGEALRSLGYRIRRLHYTLESGLALPDAEAPLRGLFDDYEAPNFLAAKDDDVFEAAVARANAHRPAAVRLLGRF